MAQTTESLKLFHRAGLIDRTLHLYMKAAKAPYKQMVNTVETRDRYYQLAALSDLPAASLINEITLIPDENLFSPWTQQIIPRSRKIKFIVSDEAYSRDPEGVYKKAPYLTERSISKALDIEGAGLLSRATDATFLTTPDQVAIASAAHLNEIGVWSNIISSGGVANPVLSYGAVEDGIVQLMGQTGYNGIDNYDLMGPYDLWVTTENVGLANRIVKAMQRHDTANHDPNWAGDLIRNVVVVPRASASTTTAWALVATGDRNPFLLVNGLGLKTHYWYDGDNDAHKWNARKMWAYGAIDARGFVYSAGA